MDDKSALLAEYRSLRAEILQNDKMIQRMSMFAFWAIVLPLGVFAWDRRLGEVLIIPPIAYFVYLQMVAHKLEGTSRIASYIAAFLEPALPGLGWERRWRLLSGGIVWIPTHVALLFVATIGSAIPCITAARGVHSYAALGVDALVFIFALVQLQSLKSAQGSFGAAWATVKKNEGED